MNSIKYKLPTIITVFLLLVASSATLMFVSSVAHAQAPPPATPDASIPVGCPGGPSLQEGQKPSPTTICPGTGDTPGLDCKDPNLNSSNCAIVARLNDFIKILSVLVGIVVTAMIIFGGIQYSAAGADPNTVAKAKKQIFNAIFALVAYGLMFAFLQYIIPGGLL